MNGRVDSIIIIVINNNSDSIIENSIVKILGTEAS